MTYVNRLSYRAPIAVAIRNSLSLAAFQSGLRRRAIKATLLLCLITVAAIAQTATTTTIQSSVGAATLAQAVKFTVTVSPASATGRVTFFDGVNILGIEPLSDGKAILTTTLLTAGTHLITAFYGGDRSDTVAVSAPLSLTVHALPDLGFQPVQTSLARLDNSRMAIGDFNLDGIPDLAVIDVLFGGQTPLALASLTVLVGNGDGTFRTTAQLSQNVYGAVTPAIADFNADGIPDIATFTGIYPGNGDGTFQSPLPPPVSGFNGNLVSLIAADFNGDGRADLAWSGFINDGSLAGVVGVVLGNGDGTFQSTLNVSLASGGVLAPGDFNADGRADLAMLSGPGQPSSVSILLGKGDGTFQTPSVYTNSAASSIAVADFNGDGRDDLGLGGSTTVSILLSNRDGTFQAALNSSIPGTVVGITAGDFNGDGHTDLAALYSSGQSTESLLLLYGNGDGTLQSPVLESTPPLAEVIIAGDFNGDGRTDLASFSNVTVPDAMILLGQATAQGPVAITKVLNAASFTAPIAAGSWVMIQGTDLAEGTRPWQSSDFNGNNLPMQLNGTSVTIDGIPAYVEYISPTQINVLAPADSTTGSVNVVVTNNGQSSAPATAQLQTYAPALFMTPQFNAIASELPNYTPVTSTAPAHAGDLVVLWCTGLGPTSPVAPVGTIVSGAPATATLPIVTIGDMQVQVISSVMTSGTAGLYQITVQLPANVPTGTPEVVASIGGVPTQSGVMLFVGAQ